MFVFMIATILINVDHNMLLANKNTTRITLKLSEVVGGVGELELSGVERLRLHLVLRRTRKKRMREMHMLVLLGTEEFWVFRLSLLCLLLCCVFVLRLRCLKL
jgi:predicted MarR family transcription regulator